MQNEVRDIRADIPWRGDADLCIHVRAIQINLTAVLMHDLAHFTDGLFIDAVSRRISHHDAGELIARLSRLFTQVVEVDVTLFIAGHNHHVHTRHLG